MKGQIMDAMEKLIAILNKAKDLPDGEEKTRLLKEADDLIKPAKEEVELSERLMRIQLEHDFGITSED
jgi:hypothetical protein